MAAGEGALMDGYVVTVEVLLDGYSPLEPYVEDKEVAVAVGEMLGHLADLHGAVEGDGRGWSATVTVDATDPDAARDAAMPRLVGAAAMAGLPLEQVTRVEVAREDVRDAELERPTMPDLVSGPEAAEILGVTRQRLHQLATNNPRFPAPAYKLGVGMLWHRAAVERFAAEDRPPGRPPADASSRQADSYVFVFGVDNAAGDTPHVSCESGSSTTR